MSIPMFLGMSYTLVLTEVVLPVRCLSIQYGVNKFHIIYQQGQGLGLVEFPATGGMKGVGRH